MVEDKKKAVNEKTVVEDTGNTEEKVIPFRVITGGGGGGLGYNWLKGLSKGSVFVTRPKANKGSAILAMYHILYHHTKATVLLDNINSEATFVVDSERFSNQMELVEVLHVGE